MALSILLMAAPQRLEEKNHQKKQAINDADHGQ
jgi:hypothetical protein